MEEIADIVEKFSKETGWWPVTVHHAAGALLVQEAGGIVTDLDGKPLDFTQGRTLAKNRGICGSNGVLHETALKALKQIGA